MLIYSLRNLIIGYTITIVVVLLILLYTFSTLRSQEKKLAKIQRSREALQISGPSLVNIQEFESDLFSYVNSGVKQESVFYNEGINKLTDDSLQLMKIAASAQDTEINLQYRQLITLQREMKNHAALILNLNKTKTNDIVKAQLNKGSHIVRTFKSVVNKLEDDNRRIITASYNDTIGLTRKTFAFVKAIAAVLFIILVLSFLSHYRDIKKREKAEAQLKRFNEELERKVEEKTIEFKKSEERYRSLIEQASDYIMITDHAGNFSDVNSSLCKMFGYTREELLRSNVSTIIDPEQLKADPIQFDALMAGKSFLRERRMMKKDGTFVEVEANVKRIPDGRILAIARDIRDRKASEKEKERVNYLLNERIKELTTLYRTGQILQTEEKSVEEVLQQIVSILPSGWQYPEITAARIILGKMEFATSNFAIGQHRQDAEFIGPGGKDGKIEVVYLEKKPEEQEGAFLTEERNLINMLAQMLQVYLARKRSTEELMKSEANLKTIFETTDDGYALLDINFNIVSYNQRGFDFVINELGATPGPSNNLIDYIPEARRAFLLNMKEEVINGKNVNYEISSQQPDNSYKWFYIRMFSIRNSENEILGLMIAASNITGMKLMEQEMVSQKVQEQKKIIRAVLKAEERERNKIGQELHDNVNQILAGTKLYLGMAEKDEMVKKDLIKSSVELIDSAIQEIRLLSKNQVTPLKAVNLEELIYSLVDKLHESSSLKTTVAFTVDSETIEDDLKLNIYRIVQEQINNVLKHAQASNIYISIKEDHEFLYVSVEDDGTGFDTAKKRNGIGVSNMINRVESFNGEFEMESSPGKGCKLKVKIPY
jgi:two-component system sensor histidine kinase UhpB